MVRLFRRREIRRLPTALMQTPESLAALVTHASLHLPFRLMCLIDLSMSVAMGGSTLMVGNEVSNLRHRAACDLERATTHFGIQT